MAEESTSSGTAAGSGTTTTTREQAHEQGHEQGHEQANDRPPISVIGLGLMGQALARTFMTHAHPVTVWNRSADKADALVAQGARRASTVAEALSAGPLVVVCLSDYTAVHALLDPATGPAADALAGRVLVNLTSGTSAQAREMADWASRHGASYIDGAIMAVPQMMGLPDTIVLYSGSPEAFDTHRATLTRLAGASTHVGADPGLAALYDLGLLSIMYAMFGGFLHALALVGTAKVDGATFMPYVTPWLTAVVSWLPGFAQDIDARRYDTDVSALDINQAALAHIVRTSREEGVSPETILPMQALVERRVAQGHGRDGLPSLIELVKHPSAPATQSPTSSDA